MRVRIEGYTVITKKLQTSYNIGVQANCKTKGVKTMAQKAHSLSHTKWMCKYHIVFTPKYRRKIIYNQYRSSRGEIFHILCQYKGVEIIEGHLMPDHVHMLVSIPPRMSVASFMGYLLACEHDLALSGLLLFQRLYIGIVYEKSLPDYSYIDYRLSFVYT